MKGGDLLRSQKSKPLYTNTRPYLDPFTATVKDYGGIKKKLTVSKVRTRQSGLVGAFEHAPRDDTEDEPPDEPQGPSSPSHAPPPSQPLPPDDPPPEPERLACNLSRARSTIFELAICNPWEYFITFTLDPQKYNRTDLKKFSKDLSRFIRNYRARHKANVKYLLIPEQHKDGESWHMHGFIMGLPEDHLRPFTLEEHIPYYIRRKLENGQSVYEWESYHKKFGFCDIEPIRNIEATSKYVTKYVTKAFDSGVTESGGHLYYASQKLNRATVIAKGQLSDSTINFDFENEYVRTKWYDATDQPENLIEPDETTKKIKKLRQGSPPQEPEWYPTFDSETGEIFPTPFDDYNNSFRIVNSIENKTIPPPLPTKKPKPQKTKVKSELDQLSFDLSIDENGFLKIDPSDITLPLD